MKKGFLWLMVIVMTITMMAIVPLAGCKTTEDADAVVDAVEDAGDAVVDAVEDVEDAVVAEEAVGGIPSVLTMPEQIAEGRPVAITVAGAPAESQPVLVAAWEEKAARFKELYPNVIIIGSDYTYSPDSFAALVAGNQVPTTFQVYLTDPGMMIDQGVPADLTSFFEAQGLGEVYNPGLLSMVSRDEKVYGIPMAAYTMGLVYNISMLEDAGFDGPPTTWDELVTMAEALTDRDAGVAGFSFATTGCN
ncbi:MAG: extracellular solute-binding protein, partial [Candidatus Lokiarchaeota archaeon]|nr:extracellular solute-binding protein [Candidatus Lokiarchaeota archaeon]